MSSFFSIITVTYNDVWQLTKTTKSILRQKFKDFEYLVIDGASGDGIEDFLKFLSAADSVDNFLCEQDEGVYDAMNKGLERASGQYVCFLNAGDTFANDTVLDKVHKFLRQQDVDGCLGWGELNDQVWASWSQSEAVKLSSLGFCHQSLFVKRSLLLKNIFDDRSHKTDSDTLQLGRLYADGAKIPIIPEVFAIRSGDQGISADLVRTKKSIIDTLTAEYPTLSSDDAEVILSFRRNCGQLTQIQKLLTSSILPLQEHLARMVLDTLFQRQSRILQPETVETLADQAKRVLIDALGAKGSVEINRLYKAQKIRCESLKERRQRKDRLKSDVYVFSCEENARIRGLKAGAKVVEKKNHKEFVVALTSFPPRLPTIQFVVQSLVEQTCPPNEILLFLGRDDIPNRNWLPKGLLDFESRGLKVQFVEKTCHQYDKFLHGAQLNATKPYIIVDDDVIYRPNSLEILLEAHYRFPNAVIANRCHLMDLTPDLEIGPYDNWQKEVNLDQPSYLLMPTGAGGVLYPPGFLSDPLATDLEKILHLAPYADDIWLKTCSLARKIPTMATQLSGGGKWYHRYTPTMRAGTLMETNVELGLNDIQIQNCAKWLDGYHLGWREELLVEQLEGAK